MTDQTQAYIPEQCYKQIQADTVQQARQQHLCRSGVERPPCLPATQAKHTQVLMYTADVYSSQRWDQANHPQIVLSSINLLTYLRNKKGPVTHTPLNGFVVGILYNQVCNKYTEKSNDGA